MKFDNRIKELVAIGASITANCQPCLQFHVEKALEYGVGEQEIVEAVEVGMQVRKGAASKMDRFASTLTSTEHPVTAKSSESCGCGA